MDHQAQQIRTVSLNEISSDLFFALIPYYYCHGFQGLFLQKSEYSLPNGEKRLLKFFLQIMIKYLTFERKQCILNIELAAANTSRCRI